MASSLWVLTSSGFTAGRNFPWTGGSLLLALLRDEMRYSPLRVQHHGLSSDIPARRSVDMGLFETVLEQRELQVQFVLSQILPCNLSLRVTLRFDLSRSSSLGASTLD